MPELPEVEMIRNIIEPQIVDQEIRSVQINSSKIIAHPETHAFSDNIKGQYIKNLERRGKFLIFNFTSGDRLLLHLRMTGKLLVTPVEFPEEKHTHLILSLSGGKQIRYVDVRRFGRFWFFHVDEKDDISGISKLGLEPLDKNLTGEYLKNKLGSRKVAIKKVLLEQHVIAGIGNIYADEILYAARIHPEQKCVDLNLKMWNVLADQIQETIALNIKRNTMSQEKYLQGKGNEFQNTPYFNVYKRNGRHCKNCGTLIERVKIGGRSSHFCPRCQKLFN